ncbi:MAG: hypothetical protein LDL31_12530, partial [Prosthecobacter sp.]|nr:hypothetical protein [Prosthecobacter sp.]
ISLGSPRLAAVCPAQPESSASHFSITVGYFSFLQRRSLSLPILVDSFLVGSLFSAFRQVCI